MDINVSELLKGTEPGRLQSCGHMQIIPLISEMVDDRFGSPLNIVASTKNYGHLVVENTGSDATILPFGAGYVTKERAQNHAAMKATVLGRKQSKDIMTAACIQQSQGGTMTRGTHHLTIIPYTMREDALAVKDKSDYSKLWPAISRFNVEMGLQNTGHLEYYLEKFEKELNEFVAEFETVPNQVGAIILINGEVVGIERAPNYAYWAAIWKPLVRESYGSKALWYSKHKGNTPPKTRVPLRTVNVKTLEDIEGALKDATALEDKMVKDIVRAFITEKFNCVKEETSAGLSVESISNKQFKGQVVRDSSAIVYASVVTSKSFKWDTAKDFKI